MGDYKFIALIPAYQPDEKLIELVDRLCKDKLEIVVVNDGSNKKDIFNKIENKCHVIHHKVNKGKGRALKTGLEFIKEHYSDKYIVITLDCDGQHTTEDAMKLFEYNVKHPKTLVLGSRAFDKNVPLRSMLGNTITRHVYALVTGVTINDTQTGLRAFSNQLIDEMINIPGERFEYEINVLLKLAKERTPIKEIEIETIYLNDNKGSHFNAFKDSFKIYKEIFKFSLSSLSSFALDFILYTIFLNLFSPFKYCLQISNVLARVFSATYNFFVNRNYVFKHKKNILKSISQYTLLAIFILFINTILLSLLVDSLMMNRLVAKVIVEVTLFIVSYIVQRCLIFKK